MAEESKTDLDGLKTTKLMYQGELLKSACEVLCLSLGLIWRFKYEEMQYAKAVCEIKQFNFQKQAF